LFQFPTGSVLSADAYDPNQYAEEDILFQFPTGSVLSADEPTDLPSAIQQVLFQFPTGSVLSADFARAWDEALADAVFQFPTGSVLSADLPGKVVRAYQSRRFNSPREVSCLPTCLLIAGLGPGRSVSIPHGKCPVCRLGVDVGSFLDVLSFNSPREVSCLPTFVMSRPTPAVSDEFQFPTGSVLSADKSAPRSALSA